MLEGPIAHVIEDELVVRPYFEDGLRGAAAPRVAQRDSLNEAFLQIGKPPRP